MTLLQAQPVADPTRDVLRRAQALSERCGLAPVADWKAAHPGQLVIGHMPVYTPRPLLEAIGCLPVAIFGGGDRDIIKGDSYFQSYICHIPRSTIELGTAGDLDELDGMIFPAICDVIRNLSGMWQLLFPQKYAAYLDVPQNFRPEVGGRFYAGELRRIARDLVARGALPYDPDRLRLAIADENRRRAALERMAQVRRLDAGRITASEAYTICRAGGAIVATEHTLLIDEFLAAASKRPPSRRDTVRVVLCGSFCEQPPVGLIRSLERAGCDIVEDDFQLGLTMIEGAIEEDASDPILALSTAFLERGAATASRYIDQEGKGDALIRRVRQSKADGVIFAAASFCDPALLDEPMLENALDRVNIPFTSFKFAENTGQFQVIREQAGAFSDAVRLWEAAT